MAWIAVVPPFPRHPYELKQVRYQEGKRQRHVDMGCIRALAPARSQQALLAQPGTHQLQ